MTASRRCSLGCFAVAVFLAAAPRPTAASDFTVLVGGDFTVSPAPVSDSFVTADSTEMARAGRDVGIFLEAHARQTNTFSSDFAGASATAISFFDDIVITGPTPTVQTAFHLVYSAEFSDTRETWTCGLGPFASTTQQSVTFSAIWSGDSRVLSVALDPEAGRIEVSDPGSFEQTTDLEIPIEFSDGQVACFGFVGIEAFRFAGEVRLAGEVPTGEALNLELSVGGQTNASSFFVADAGATTDVFNSFGLRGGTVFELPPGYTANSPSLGIVDNVTVPEPASARLAALCAIAAVGWASRQRGCTRTGSSV